MINGRHVVYRGGVPSIPKTGRLFVEETGCGNQLFYDGVFGRIFRSSLQEIKNACKMITEQNREDECNYNDLYALLKMSQNKMGSKYGWRRANYGDHKGLITFNLTIMDKDNNLARRFSERIICIKPDHDSMPYENYWL